MLLDSLLGPPREETRATAMTLGHPRNDTLADWFTGSPAHSGVLVNQHSALTVGAVYRAIALISGCVSRIPLHVYRDLGNDRHQREDGHDYEYLLNVRPNGDMDAQTFRELSQAWTLSYGTSPSEVVYGRRNVVQELWPIKPARVTPKRIDRRMMYEVTDEDGGRKQTLPQEKLFTMLGPSPDGVVGYSPIRLMRETIGLGLATERYGAGFFGNSAVPKGVFYYEGQKSEQAERHFREMFNETHQGVANSNKFGVLRAGWKYQQISIPPEDAQFLETRKFAIVEIARWYGVPPHLLADLERATYTNIEQQSLEFLLYCLDYWLNKWEARLRLALFSEQEIRAGFYFKHQRKKITEMDQKTRAEANREAIHAGYRTPNEARVSEGDNPAGAELDLYWFPLNSGTAAQALKQQELTLAGKSEGEEPPEGDAGKTGPRTPPAEQPLETPVAAAEHGKTSQTGLAGQQITALQSILSSVAAGELAKPAAKELIRVSFPLLGQLSIDKLVDTIEAKKASGGEASGGEASGREASGVRRQASGKEKAEDHLPGNAEADNLPLPPGPQVGAPGRGEGRGAAPGVTSTIPPALREAARRNLADVLGRLAHRQLVAAKQNAAKRSADWPAWVEEYFGRHEPEAVKALLPAAEVLAAIAGAEGQTVTPEFLAAELARTGCQPARCTIAALPAHDTAELTAAIDNLARDWSLKPQLPGPLADLVRGL